MYASFFIYLLEVNVCLIVLFLFFHFALKNDNFFQTNRWYLIISLIFSFFIPALHVSVDPESYSNTAMLILGLDEMILDTIEQESEAVIAQSFDLSKILFVIYCCGALLFSLKMFSSLNYIYRIIKKAKIEKRVGYNIVNIDSKLPVFSFFSYIFWSNEMEYENHEVEQIIKHEQVHINQKHSFDLMFFELANIVLWFNPFVYFYKRNLKNIHEFIADQDLFEKQKYYHKYLDLLVRESKRQHQLKLPVVHTFYNNQLKKRLIMIKNNNRQSNKLKVYCCLPFIAALVLCFSFESNVMAQNSEAQASPESGNIYVVTDTENSFTLKADGSKRSPNEIKEFIIESNKKEGKTVNEEQIFLISKEDMNRNLNAHAQKKDPLLKGEFRIVYVQGGRLMVLEMDGKKPKPPLKVLSFTASIQKAKGPNAKAPMDFTTFTLNHNGDSLNKAALDMIDSIDKNLLVKSYISFTDIVVEKKGKKFTLDKTAKFDLKL